ncbi:hypothetical protein RV03_GL003160 [Enterococcus gallinarum]|nr:hypothetical protein RV03_GL003160 [Enterococcus gallinarum]
MFSSTTRCEPKARRRTLSYTKMTNQKQKSEVNTNKKESELSQKVARLGDNLRPKMVG